MTKLLKKIIKKFLVYLGIHLEVSKKQLEAYNNFDAIHKFLVNNFLDKEKITIFDVGANAGDSIERFRNILQNCSIYSFEPIQEIFKKLKKLFKK